MKKLFITILFFVLATACGSKDKGFMPERLLSETEMITIMTDVQIIEADLNTQKMQESEQDITIMTDVQIIEADLNTQKMQESEQDDGIAAKPKDYVKLSREYYAQLFDHYGITDSIFTQNLKYYTERPATLERIMDSVMQRLVREQSEP